MKKKNFYFFLVALCFLGWVWLVYNLFFTAYHHNQVSICLFKNVTGAPCPSCGTTRSVISFFQGDFIKALLTNPIGIVGSLGLLLAPFWLIYDFILHKDSFFRAFLIFEKYFKKPYIYVPFAILILLNWIWNFYKDL
ncbi:hypothetical protein CGC56_05340 [Capnocytophaga canimorsus]|uniref:DUF2752 domain-containing protein n=1 Tax=Capnocytophaga canimorsus TaxID=28188 RepID=A0A250G5X5_9FLAO|nr:hypothetical protein CGC56_05340 [Capnocytophaga canimorsus]ATA93800.1 hypothetical protein CGC54_05330 [Capnocytophaga canimorsus]